MNHDGLSTKEKVRLELLKISSDAVGQIGISGTQSGSMLGKLISNCAIEMEKVVWDNKTE